MKKIFSYLAAAAMLFAASCTKDNVGTDNGNEAQVTFNLGLEGQSGTRAIGDGTRVNELYYAVFEKGATTPLEAYKCKKAHLCNFLHTQSLEKNFFVCYDYYV